MSKTENTFFVPPNRQQITRERDPGGQWTSQFPDMIGFSSQGGGRVPADFAWRTNPKQWQEELTEAALATRGRGPAVHAATPQAALPTAAKP